MSTNPVVEHPAVERESPPRSLPDYLPARMINEYVYCPRLFYYEQVEGVFVHNEHTAEGSAQHKRVDKAGKSAPKPDEDSKEPTVVRSITLSSEEHRVIAKLDLTEFAEGRATPVDYKRGRPMKQDDGLQPWPSDRVQIAVQGLVLRANGYRCDEGIVFYQKTRQRVRIPFDEKTMAEAKKAIAEAWETDANFTFDFRARNRRPPRDPVNALLSLGYSLLAKDLTVACYAVGFDPMIGFYHQPRHGRPALALDLMEPLRTLIADSAVLSVINTKMVSARDFVTAGRAVSLTASGRKSFLRAYEARMNTLVTHPLFNYRVSYRRLLEIQARLLAKTLEGEVSEYTVFVTR